MSIIHQFDLATQPVESSPQVRALLQEVEPYMDRIQAALGRKFVNDLFQAEMDAHSLELEESYRRGFLDAFALWREVLAQP